MVRIETALAAYRTEKNAYPEALDALKPQYLVEVPNDGFSGTPLKYRKTEQGYLLYSVGVNLKDDGGVTIYSKWNKGSIQLEAGDLVMQVP